MYYGEDIAMSRGNTWIALRHGGLLSLEDRYRRGGTGHESDEAGPLLALTDRLIFTGVGRSDCLTRELLETD